MHTPVRIDLAARPALAVLAALGTLGALGAAVALPRPALAQDGGAQGAPAPRSVHVGVVAGVNRSTYDVPEPDVDLGHRTAFVGGAVVRVGVTRALSVQPELLYSMKGIRSRFDATSSSGAVVGRVTSTVKLDYLEVPVLARLDVPTAGPLDPHLYAGPAVAVRTTCRVVVRGTVAGFDQSDDCDAGADDDGPRRLDVGLVFGGGLALDLGGGALSLGARYDLGLRSLAPDARVRNRALSLVAGYAVPLRR